MEMTNTNDLDIFLIENSINYNTAYEEPHGYKENGYLRYCLFQMYDADRHYSVDIHNVKLVTFEYESEKYNYVSISLFEETGEWKNINKHKLFEIILEHMTTHVESDND